MNDFFDMWQLELILRMVVAGLCGVAIGLERKNRSKEAGIRTHCVVACAAALMMIVSKYAFNDMINGVFESKLDPSRVASTIASGIGFLGAGMIFVHKNTVTGLTTAAGVWATSGVGMAIGAGMYTVGISATVILIAAQVLLHLNFAQVKTAKLKALSVKGVTQANYQHDLTEILSQKGISVSDVSVENGGEGVKNYTFFIELPPTVTEEELVLMIGYPSAVRSALD